MISNPVIFYIARDKLRLQTGVLPRMKERLELFLLSIIVLLKCYYGVDKQILHDGLVELIFGVGGMENDGQ